MATIRKLQTGNYQVIVRRKGLPPQSRTFTAKTDADKWARAIESEMDRGTFIDRTTAENTTLAELIDRYIAEVTPLKKSAHVERQRLHYLKRHFGHYSAASLQSQHIAAWRDKRLKEGKSGSTVVKELNNLSHLIDTAIKDWGIGLTHNPAKLVRKPKQARGRERRLTADELDMILKAADQGRTSQPLKSIILFAIETGMRLGELLRLTWTDIDQARQLAKLHETKNGETRTVPLSTYAIGILTSMPHHITETRVFWQWKKADSFEGTWKRNLNRAKQMYIEECSESSIEPAPSFLHDIRFHDTRHEATSRFFEKGLNPMEVATITGHKTLSMLMRYTHLKPESLLAKIG